MTASEHDFDFIFGNWSVHNSKLLDTTDPTCTEWAEFEAVSHVSPILHGFGHVDRMIVEAPTDGGHPFEGFTLRLFNPQSATWRIWWSSTRAPGILDTPVEGTFIDGIGTFQAEDIIGGRPALVRFEWIAVGPDAPSWQQSFSYDSATTWTLNWTMHLTPLVE
jgi:hypothetical protein